jgi:hypothetical protein
VPRSRVYTAAQPPAWTAHWVRSSCPAAVNTAGLDPSSDSTVKPDRAAEGAVSTTATPLCATRRTVPGPSSAVIVTGRSTTRFSA